MKNETIEQKAYRLIVAAKQSEPVTFFKRELTTDELIIKVLELAIAEEREACGWQPIETIPKDGTEIDLWVHGERIADCSLLNGKWMFYGIDSFDRPGYVAVQGEPTHWKPLPAAPKDEVSE